MSKRVDIQKQQFVLHSSGALFWEEEALLVISDVHLGKIAHFRKHGSALPKDAMVGNFKKLTQVVTHFNPARLCFLGDLFHSAINQEWRLFEAWLEEFEIPMLLVEGNHDIISPMRFEALEIEVQPELQLKNFFFTHHPERRDGLFNFSGHVHPGIKLSGWGRQSLKLPCFFQSENQMILPAFGEFTGNHILSPGPQDKVYALAGEKVVEIH